jgi:hypothetical protein
MTNEQREIMARVLHLAYADWHAERYRIEKRTWEQIGIVEQGLFLSMAIAAGKATKAMQDEQVQGEQT